MHYPRRYLHNNILNVLSIINYYLYASILKLIEDFNFQLLSLLHFYVHTFMGTVITNHTAILVT